MKAMHPAAGDPVGKWAHVGGFVIGLGTGVFVRFGGASQPVQGRPALAVTPPRTLAAPTPEAGRQAERRARAAKQMAHHAAVRALVSTSMTHHGPAAAVSIFTAAVLIAIVFAIGRQSIWNGLGLGVVSYFLLLGVWTGVEYLYASSVVKH